MHNHHVSSPCMSLAMVYHAWSCVPPYTKKQIKRTALRCKLLGAILRWKSPRYHAVLVALHNSVSGDVSKRLEHTHMRSDAGVFLTGTCCIPASSQL